MDFQGDQCEKMENSRGVMVDLTGNPNFMSNSKKIDILNRGGGVQFLSGKAQSKTSLV